MDFNKKKLYGFSDWKLDEEKLINGKKESEADKSEILNYGEVRFRSFSLAGDLLKYMVYVDGKPSPEKALQFHRVPAVSK